MPRVCHAVGQNVWHECDGSYTLCAAHATSIHSQHV